MAKLFSKEYHDHSNTWYYKSKILPLSKGELQYQAVENEHGNLVIRFFAVPEKMKYLPEDLLLIYDHRQERIIEHICKTCPGNPSCNHFLTIIDYAYKYITTPQIDQRRMKSTEETETLKALDEEDSELKIDHTVKVHIGNLLSYNAYWQSLILNGRILIEGLYNRESNKVRFRFSGYQKMDLRLIAHYALNKGMQQKKGKGRIKEFRQEQEYGVVDVKMLKEQIAAFRDSELALLQLLQTIKCSYSKKYQYYTIYKEDLIRTFPLLRDLQSKVLIGETGEKLRFSDEDYSLHLYIERGGENLYRIRVAKGYYFSVFYSANELYIIIENCVHRLRFPFRSEVNEQILQDGYLFKEKDLIYFATIVAKQMGLSKCYLDFAPDIELPIHFVSTPEIGITLSKNGKSVVLNGKLSYRNDPYSSSGTATDEIYREIPFGYLFFETELLCLKNRQGCQEWYYLPYEKREEVKAFLSMLPPPDEDRMTTESQYIYTGEDKKDRLKKIIYEKTPPDWRLDLDDELKKEFIFRVELKPVINVIRTSKINWFDYEISYHFQDVSFDHKELIKFFKRKEKYLKLPDNRLVYFSGIENFKQIDEYLKQAEKSGSKGSLLSGYNLSYLYMLTKVNENVRVVGEEYLECMYKELIMRRSEETGDIPLSLYNVMRSYQKTGFYWMKMLNKYGLGGLLADDMGLGKTLQALAILSDYYGQRQEERKISLVICPKTLLFNWATEIDKFHPNLTYTIYEGTKEERIPLLKNCRSDILIVSYSLVQMDIESYLEQDYAFVILDEAQHIKNPSTLRAKAVKRLKTDNRFALTGTPIENNLIDLWSIFDFLMPGYLQPLRSFRRDYSEDQNNIEEKKERITQIVSPFLLRRKKSEVLLELPDRQEQILINKMTPQQEKIYLKILTMAKEKLFSAEDKDEKSEYINILTALIRLRQICNHPGLIDEEMLNRVNVSGKMELLMELIQDAVENRRKMLVFSQFAMMLQLIAGHLNERNLTYEYMDGKTVNRQERIEHFTNNEKIRIFLLTLKVGGLGLNLTAADTVIIVDPWWNPMSENQSVDRVYRIGQTKKVNVYKLITKGTVEEKILQLQEHKKHLFSSVIEGSQSLLRKMTADDIRNLFEYSI